MPKVRMPDGSFLDVGLDALFADDGQVPLNIPTGPVFTAEDVERVRSEEKAKLYPQIDALKNEISGLKENLGTLTAAEQQRLQDAEAEKRRLEQEARQREEQELDAKTLIERRTQEWQQTLAEKEQSWAQRLEAESQARQQAEALAAKEREFSDLREYTQAQIASNQDKIAPQLLGWIQGNSREEIDAAIARAVETTDAIAAEMQQVIPQQQVDPVTGQPVAPQQQVVPQPPPLPGTRPTAGPANSDPGAQFQTLTADQIKNMPMDQWSQMRRTLGIGGQSNSQGLFG